MDLNQSPYPSMKRTRTSIFNNVLGPVMRGPSSSHTAAALRIGTVARQLLGEEPSEAVFTFDPNGSLATTYLGQGSAMGLAGGLLGLAIIDPSISDWKDLCKKSGLKIEFKTEAFNASHPNTYKALIKGKEGAEISFTALSTGGGAIQFTEVNDIPVNFDGSGYEVIAGIINQNERERILNSLKTGTENRIIIRESDRFIHFHSSEILADQSVLKSLFKSTDTGWICSCTPVMPVIMNEDPDVPFKDIYEFTSLVSTKGGRLSEYALEYETSVGKIQKVEVLKLVHVYLNVIKDSAITGLKGTSWNDRILHSQSPLIRDAEKKGALIPDSLTNEIIATVSAIMETKSSMGTILAAPTAGSCGTIGGVLIPVGTLMKKDDESLSGALLAAGLFGVFIADETGFAAEEGGCQYECGAASGMAAAALVDLAGGDALTALNAGSLALQNIIGLVCDPVADRVEVPCLGKNIMAALNALASANMALAGFDTVIPAGEVIEAMKSVGCSMPHELRCTGKGGLAVTPSAMKISFKE
jgi:L-serine dehydratase